MSHKKKPAGYFPLNPGCLIGILAMVYYKYNWVVFPSPRYPKQPGFLCIAQMAGGLKGSFKV